MMTCGEARRLAWPDNAPRAVDDAVAAAEAHVAECAACAAFVADMRAVADRIAASAPRPPAPLETRERLFAALAWARAERERARRSRAVALRLGAAGVAALLIIAIAVWQWAPPLSGQLDPVRRLADDHRRALDGAGLTSNDTAVVARWLARRVGFGVRVPTFAGGRLVGARLCELDGRRGAVLTYRIDGQDVSYYIIPAPEQGTSPGASGPAVRAATWAGLGIAAWHEPGLMHALVGILPTARLRSLAHECIRQMLAAVPAAARNLGTSDRRDARDLLPWLSSGATSRVRM